MLPASSEEMMGNLGVEHNYKFLPTRVGVNANLQRFSIAQGAGTHCLCDISVIREDLPEGKTLIGTWDICWVPQFRKIFWTL